MVRTLRGNRLSRLIVLAAVVFVTSAAPVGAASKPDVVPLPGATSAEGIASGTGSTFYAGDLFSGDIYRGDLQHGTASLFIDAPANRMAAGMKFDASTGLLFVAGLFMNPDRAWRAYHVSWLYFTVLSSAGVMFVAVQRITTARWSRPIIRLLEGYVAFLPVAFVFLLITVLLGKNYVFPWTHEAYPVPEKALYFGPLAALMSELFPPATRATGLGLSYNIGVTVFGGMGPAFMTWLGGFALIGNLAPGYYLTVVCVLSLWALVTIRWTSADAIEA